MTSFLELECVFLENDKTDVCEIFQGLGENINVHYNGACIENRCTQPLICRIQWRNLKIAVWH